MRPAEHRVFEVIGDFFATDEPGQYAMAQELGDGGDVFLSQPW